MTENIDLAKVDPLFVDDSRDMVLLYLSKDGVAITRLTEEGKADFDTEENFAPPGMWGDWTNYLGKDEALKQLAEILGV